MGTARIPDTLAELAVPIDQLKPHRRNPRRGDVDAIAASLDRNGQYRPVVVNRRTGEILAGNHTWHAARALGWTEVAATFVDVTEDQAARILLADNRTAELGGFDTEALTELLAELEDVEGTGYSDDDLQALLGNLDRDQDRDVDAIPELPGEPTTRPGDLWTLGGHRLLCGDTFDADDVDRLTGGEEVAMVATDPPYAIYGSSTGISSEIADDKMVRPFFEAMARQVARVLRWWGHAYVHCDWRSWAALWEGAKRAGLTPKNALVWDKGSGLGSNYGNHYELVGFFAKLPKKYAMGDQAQAGQRMVHRPNVLRIPRVPGRERQHHAAKPVALLSEVIGNSSDPGDVVLDLFLGSGSTMIAAEEMGRRCLAMEIDPLYADVAVRRWEAFTGGTAERVPGESH